MLFDYGKCSRMTILQTYTRTYCQLLDYAIYVHYAICGYRHYNIHAAMQYDPHVKPAKHYRMSMKRDISNRHDMLLAVASHALCSQDARHDEHHVAGATAQDICRVVSMSDYACMSTEPFPTTGKSAFGPTVSSSVVATVHLQLTAAAPHAHERTAAQRDHTAPCCSTARTMTRWRNTR